MRLMRRFFNWLVDDVPAAALIYWAMAFYAVVADDLEWLIIAVVGLAILTAQKHHTQTTKKIDAILKAIKPSWDSEK